MIIDFFLIIIIIVILVKYESRPFFKEIGHCHGRSLKDSQFSLFVLHLQLQLHRFYTLTGLLLFYCSISLQHRVKRLLTQKACCVQIIPLIPSLSQTYLKPDIPLIASYLWENILVTHTDLPSPIKMKWKSALCQLFSEV